MVFAPRCFVARTWSIWQLERDDGARSQLWRIHSFEMSFNWSDDARRDVAIAEIGFEPDRERFAARYVPSIEHATVAARDDEYDVGNAENQFLGEA